MLLQADICPGAFSGVVLGVCRFKFRNADSSNIVTTMGPTTLFFQFDSDVWLSS